MSQSPFALLVPSHHVVYAPGCALKALLAHLAVGWCTGGEGGEG